MTSKEKTKQRDLQATRARILSAAKKEFSRNGLGGARVDEIADRAKANKRMIYHCFESKEGLFKAVVEMAYLDIRKAEQKLALDQMPAREALEKLVRFTWNYYLKNPEFVTLVNSENLHRARHIKGSEAINTASRQLVAMVSDILKRGEAEGIFRPNIDPIQLNLTIAAINYYYMTNRFTGAILFQRDFMTEEALEERIAFNIDTIMRLVAA